MQKLVQSLKSEITRLARKEVKAQTEVLRSTSARYRRDITQLKRAIADLERRLAYVEAQERQRARKPPSPKLAEGTRFSAKGLRSHRKKLGLSAEDYGLLAGVSGQTIYNYERGDTKPRRAQMASLVAIRGLGKREAQRRLALLQK